MAKSIGIDLGTTNSVAAIKKITTEVLKNSEGGLITPSCVTLKKKKFPFAKPEFVVGRNALEWMKQDPINTIVAVKRLMGRSYRDTDVQKIIQDKRLRYLIQRHSKGTENSLAILLAGKEYTPDEISSKILEKIRRDVEKSEGDDVEYAVITVPAYFNDKQKHATRTAAALTGLKVQRLLPEPTAAAISFGVGNIKDDDAKTVLVFDFGGGTFDISVLTISGGQFIEQGKGGDMWLGGEDIDQDLADYVLKETAKEYEIEDISAFIENQDALAKKQGQRNQFLAELKTQVEKAKIRLSAENEAFVEILGLLVDNDGDRIDVDVEISRKQFETLIAPMIAKTVELTRRVLDGIHFTPDLIDNVLLVGGSSNIPAVVKAMQELFGANKVHQHERPMLAVSEGAAILSHRLADTYECPKCGLEVSQSDINCSNCEFDLDKYKIDTGVLDIVHSAAHDYFICLENNEKFLFVEKNTPLPFTKSETFRLVNPEQRLIHMKFINTVNEVEESIGDLWLGIDSEYEEDDEPKAPGQVEITLNIDENNIIEVNAQLKTDTDNAETQSESQMTRTLSRGKADEKLFLELEKVITDANEAKYNKYVMLDLLYRSLAAVRDINMVIDPAKETVDESLYKRASLKIDKAQKMADQDESSMPAIFYAESLLDSFGSLISHKERKKIRKKMAYLKDMDENGNYQENVDALNDFRDSVNELGGVNTLMQVRKAGDICMQTDPGKANKYYRCIDDFIALFKKGEVDQASEKLRDIIPEVQELTMQFAQETSVIHKDIVK
ncbi:Hsp70 family protein [Desulfococcaceae bacterium HSG9]|nr:Hsp70 family protein [Desulfococcaceae bacterium HSG9]